MSTESNVAESAPEPIGSPQELIAAREKRGWSMSDVASKLGMMPRQIDAIENGRWEALPGHAFVRGAIRAYGKALQADVGPLLATLGDTAQVPELRASASLDAPMPRRGALGFDNGGSGSRLTWIVLGVLGVVAIAMYFGRGADLSRVLDAPTSGRAIESVPVQPSGTPAAVPPGGEGSAASSSSTSSTSSEAAASQSGGTSTGASPAPRAGVDAQALPAPAAGSSESDPARSAASAASSAGGPASAASGSAGADAGSMATSGPGRTPAGATTPSASTETGSGAAASAGPAAAAGDTTAGSPDSLVLRFERESWVEVRDANGRRLLYGTEPAQSTREVSGRKPYSVTLGNAPFVRLEHDGRTIDLGAVTRNGVARLTVE